jgi:hypothetical protein
MKAWLVTWEWAGEHAKRKDKVAAIFNSRLSAERIREFVEFIYLSEYCLGERMAYALHKDKNPYPAHFGSLKGVKREGQIHCGHNPHLFARLVDDLAVERDEHGNEKATWKERPKPDIKRE